MSSISFNVSCILYLDGEKYISFKRYFHIYIYIWNNTFNNSNQFYTKGKTTKSKYSNSINSNLKKSIVSRREIHEEKTIIKYTIIKYHLENSRRIVESIILSSKIVPSHILSTLRAHYYAYNSNHYNPNLKK